MKKIVFLLLILLTQLSYSRQTPHVSNGVLYLNFDVVFDYTDTETSQFWDDYWSQVNTKIWNATNGQVQLGNIYVYPKNQIVEPDITFFNTPNMNPTGTIGDYLQIYYFTNPVRVNQPNWTITGAGVKMYLDWIKRYGPSVMVHELGHYVFGLVDEYKGYWWDDKGEFDAGNVARVYMNSPWRPNSLGIVKIFTDAATNSVEYKAQDNALNEKRLTQGGTDVRTLINCEIGTTNINSLMSSSTWPSTQWEIDRLITSGSNNVDFCDGSHTFGIENEDLDHVNGDDFFIKEHNCIPAYDNQSTWETLQMNLNAYFASIGETSMQITIPSTIPFTVTGTPDPVYIFDNTVSNTMVMVYDISGSMGGNNIKNAVSSGEIFTSDLSRDANESKIALVSYNSNATVAQPLVSLSTDKANKLISYKTALSNLESQTGGRTSIGAGLEKAIDVSNDLAVEGIRSIFIFSDGKQNTDPSPEDFYAELKREGIVVNTVAISPQSGAKVLEDLAMETGGKYRYVESTTALVAAVESFYRANVGDGEAMAAAGELAPNTILTDPVEVDVLMEKIDINIYQLNYLDDPISTSLTSPSGLTYPNIPGVTFTEGDLFHTYTVDVHTAGEFGTWFVGTYNYSGEDIRYEVAAYSNNGDNSIEAKIRVPSKIITMSDPLPILATFRIGGDLTDVVMAVDIFDERDNLLHTVTLYDDGTNGDGDPEDGLYGNNTFSSYPEPGTYKAVLRAETRAGISIVAYKGSTQSIPRSGTPTVIMADVKRTAIASFMVGDPDLKDGDTFEIINVNSNKCTDVEGAGLHDGSNVQQWDCNATNAQKWEIQHVFGSTYSIQNINSGRFLDVADYGNAENIQQWGTAVTGNSNKWDIKLVAKGVYEFRPVSDLSKCMDVESASLDAGANIRTFTCNQTGAQKFYLKRVTQPTVFSGIYYLRNIKSNYCLDVANASYDDGANIQQYFCNYVPAQQWELTNIGGNVYSLRNINSGKLLDVAWGGNGSNVQQWGTTANGNERKWEINETSSGAYTFSPLTDLTECLDVAWASTEPTANIQSYTCNGNLAQKFEIIRQ